MNIRQWMEKGCKALTAALRGLINGKTIGLSLLALDFALLGNGLLLGLGHSLHVLVQIAEITLEHFLENAFDLTPRQAQFGLAYSALFLGLGLVAYFTRRAFLALRRGWLAVKSIVVQRAEGAITVWKNAEWHGIIIALGTIGATLFLLA